MTRVLLFAIAAIVTLGAFGPASAADRAVTITRTAFVPADVTIAANDSVTWRNTDSIVHRVSFDKAPCNLTIQPAASASCTFRAGGRFNYTDPSQRRMRGTVTVTGPRTSVSLSSSARAATFGAAVTLSGFASNQQANETVTVLAQECGKTSFTRIGTANTTAGGAWSFVVKPGLKTAYQAQWRANTSAAANVNVRPKLALSRSRSRFRLRVTAAQPFTGKVVLFQRYRPRVKRWATIKRVKLGAATTPTAGTVVTSAVFRSRVRRGSRLRTFMPQAQAGACYIAASSNILRVR
jgi:plastocyanin